MIARRPRRVVYRGLVPLWLLILIAPLGVLFLTSLVLAIAIAGAGAAIAAFVLPRWWRRRVPPDHRTIELDASQYHRLEGRRAPFGDVDPPRHRND